MKFGISYYHNTYKIIYLLLMSYIMSYYEYDIITYMYRISGQ